MAPRRIECVALSAAFVLVAGCGGEPHWSADNAWTASEHEGERPKEAQEIGGAPTATPGAAPTSPTAWVGVRHDLMLDPKSPKTARCSCLAVEVGAPNNPKLAWQNGAPEVGGDALAIAVSAHGVDCPGGSPDETKRRASIAAVDREGADVVVEIEEIPEGRPLASGAIIPKPGPGGGVYVHGRSAKLPYAKPVGGRRCKVL